MHAAVLGFTSPVWAVSPPPPLSLHSYESVQDDTTHSSSSSLWLFVRPTVLQDDSVMNVISPLPLLSPSQVRNSSTLLFSTLITRIFGVKKGKDEHSKENRSGPLPSLLDNISDCHSKAAVSHSYLLTLSPSLLDLS